MGNADQSAAIRPLDLPPVSTPIDYAGQSGGFAVRLQQGLAATPARYLVEGGCGEPEPLYRQLLLELPANEFQQAPGCS